MKRADSLLVELVGKKHCEQFFDESWPGKPMVRHGPVKRLRVAEVPELQSPAALAKAWTGRISAWAKAGSGMPAIEAVPDQAPALYEVGYTLFFANVQRHVPAIRDLAREFADATGVSYDRVSCEAFFSKGGSGAPPHFDPYAGFNVQLVGEKEWQLRKNDHVEFPITGGAMIGHPDPAHYGSARLPFPERMPDDAERVMTRAGTVVFVPAGYWHATRALEGASVAIVFSMNRDPWSGKVAKEIESRLNKSLAVARSSPLLNLPSLYERQRDELESVLGALKKIVNELETESLMQRWISRDRPRFGIPRGVTIKFVDREATRWTLHVRQGERQFDTQMHRSFAEVLFELARKKSLAYEELCAKLPARSPAEVLRVAEELVDIGLLQVVPPAWL